MGQIVRWVIFPWSLNFGVFMRPGVWIRVWSVRWTWNKTITMLTISRQTSMWFLFVWYCCFWTSVAPNTWFTVFGFVKCSGRRCSVGFVIGGQTFKLVMSLWSSSLHVHKRGPLSFILHRCHRFVSISSIKWTADQSKTGGTSMEQSAKHTLYVSFDIIKLKKNEKKKKKKIE